MSRRKPDSLYAGAKGRTTMSKAAKMGRNVIAMCKADGAYGVVTFGASGELGNIILRSGKVMTGKLRQAFNHIRYIPGATVIGEIEAFTEASNRTSARRGYRKVFAFDALRIGGKSVSHLPFGARRDLLLRAESKLMCDPDTNKPWRTDKDGNHHSITSGRFTAPIPRSWGRISVLPTMPAHKVETAWAEYVDAERDAPVEGLVLCDLDAPIGKGKVKLKRVDELDCTVLRVSEKTVMLSYGGHPFVVGRGKWRLKPGAIVSVAAEGMYESSVTPRFPRIVRVRFDLMHKRKEAA